MARPVRLFISYARNDRQNWLLRVREHLLGLKRVGLLDIWEDARIGIGEVWDETIAAAIDAADIILLLVSAAYNASEVCHCELNRALQRRNKGMAQVVWLYIDHCDYEAMPYGRLQGMPKGNDLRLLPMNSIPSRKHSLHLAEMSKEIRALAARIAEARGGAGSASAASVDLHPREVPADLVARAAAISVEQGVPTQLLQSILNQLMRIPA